MLWIAEHQGTRFFQKLTGQSVMAAPLLNQNFKSVIKIQASDGSGNPVDLSTYSASMGFVGAPGTVDGAPGSPALAAYTNPLAWDATNKWFSGILDCTSAATGTLIGAKPKVTSRFGVLITKDGDQYECQTDIVVGGAVVDPNGVSPAQAPTTNVRRVAPVLFTVQDQQTLSAEVVVPGVRITDLVLPIHACDGSTVPAVGRFMVNENPSDPTQNTIQAELVAEAAGIVSFYAQIYLNQ